MRRATVAAACVIAALLGGLGGSAGAGGDRVPWPRGLAPSAPALDERVAEAVELYDLERAEEYLEAFERGEDSEHIFVLQETIDAGEISVERLFQIGDAAFEHEFRREDGYGDGARQKLRRVHDGAYGGRDNFSCAGCHALGGANGAGTATATSFYFGDGARVRSAVARNPPAVLGLGYVQALAAEMSRALARQRDEARAAAARTGEEATVALDAKGISFGAITARPDGSLDVSAVEGVDPDLVIKPFGWKGHTARLRRFAERAARLHFGIQSHVLALDHQEDPDPGLYGWGRHWWDPDGDGRQRELEEGTLTALAVYMALLEVPVMIPPDDPALRARWARGSEIFDRIGCSDCHRRSLSLVDAVWRERADTTEGVVTIALGADGEPPRADSVVMLFSDLKRHDMGDDLADAVDDPDGIGRNVFLTRPLWGLSETAPYLHDGRAGTILEAVRWHGGEAAMQRESFEALEEEARRDLHVFLLSLGREPKLRVAR